MKSINIQLAGFLGILLLVSTISLAQSNNCIIELETGSAPDNSYKLDVIALSEVEYSTKHEEHLFENVNGVLKCTISIDAQPKAITISSKLPFEVPGIILIEPGDSVRVKVTENGLVFTGVGSAKYEMIYNNNLFVNANGGRDWEKSESRYSVTSVNEYLQYRNVLESVWCNQLMLLENNRDKISRLAFVFFKGYYFNQYRYYLSCKFSILALKKAALNVNEQDLIQIYDSTLKPLAFKSDETDTASMSPVGRSLRKYAEVDYERTISFTNGNERSEILVHRANRYYHAKKMYSGLAQRKALLSLVMGRVIHKINDKEEQRIVLDFLELTKNTSTAKYVKDYIGKDELLKRGEKAPLFTLKDKFNKDISLDSLKGKAVLLDFWFTGCTGCKQMAGPLKEVEKQFAENSHIEFVSISIDKNKSQWLNSISKETYTTKTGVNLYTGGVGENHTVIKDYNIRSYPSMFLIDSTGKFVKPVPDPRQDNGRGLSYLIKKLLPASPVDGPYVIYENNFITVKSVHAENRQLKVSEYAKSIKDKHSIQLNVPIGNSGKYFTTKLKDSLINESSVYEKPARLLALSDIEGNFTSLVDLLMSNNVIDNNFNWTFNDGHLVLTGDFFDRGDQVTETLWLIYSLEEKAKANGGYVHFILGNHEIMNLTGDIRYVNNKYKVNSKLLKEDYVYGLYGNNSELGRWVRTKNIIEKIGNVLYTHAGISPQLSRLNLPLQELNSRARPFYDTPPALIKNETAAAIMSEKEGLFWYRGYYKNEDVTEQQIDSILAFYNAEKIVTGHTLIADADKITSHFNGKVINTDTHHAAGLSAALLFEHDQFYQVDYAGRKKMLIEGKDLLSNKGLVTE